MPHTILEYSRSSGIAGDLAPFFQELHAALAATELVELGRLKGRAVEHQMAVVGSATGTGFVFLQISLLDGRSLEERATLSATGAEVLDRWCKRWKLPSQTSVTVEVRQIERATHRRIDLAE